MDALKIIAAIVVVIAAFLFGILTLWHWYATYQCANYERITGKETKFAAYDICYIKTADGWQRWDEYTRRAVASEGLKEVGK